MVSVERLAPPEILARIIVLVLLREVLLHLDGVLHHVGSVRVHNSAGIPLLPGNCSQRTDRCRLAVGLARDASLKLLLQIDFGLHIAGRPEVLLSECPCCE